MHTDQNQINIELFCRAVDSVNQLLNTSTDSRETIVHMLLLYLLEMDYIERDDIRKLINILEYELPSKNQLYNQLEDLVGGDFRHAYP